MFRHPLVRSQDSVVGIVTRLLAGKSGIRIPARSRDSSLLRTIQPGSGAQPASCFMSTRGFSLGGELSGHGVGLITHHHLVLGLGLCGAVPLPTLYVFMACTGMPLTLFIHWRRFRETGRL
jgi:hypothetical protein